MLGYPEELARVLAELTTTNAKLGYGTPREERLLYNRRHLPQGAPTSPAIANIAATTLDRRLAGLAEALGGDYTRYADDLAISCDQYRDWIVPTAAAIATDEGFSVNYRKTRVRSSSKRQMLTGLVVNDRVGMSRTARKELEALLVNCVRHGPASQDLAGRGAKLEAYIRGRVAQARHVDPDRTRHLEGLLARIDWTD